MVQRRVPRWSEFSELIRPRRLPGDATDRRLARAATVGQVSLLLLGWGLAQYPYLIYPDMTLRSVAAPEATLRFVLYSLPVGLALLVPSLWLLFRVFKAERP